MIYNCLFISKTGSLEVSHTCHAKDVEFWLHEGYFIRRQYKQTLGFTF